MHTKKFPAPLHASTPAAGQLLARQLAESALAERTTAPADMAAHLATPPAPSIEMLTAVYFQTVAAANAGWTR